MKAAAVCIGNNHFRYSPGNDLQGCIPDAHAMADLFQGMGIPTVSLRENSDRTDTWMLLKDLRERARVDKLAYAGFAFSSHGTTYPCNDEDDGLGEALVCADIKAVNGEWTQGLLSDKDFHLWLMQFPRETVLEIWLDCCFAGGMDRPLSASRKDRCLTISGGRTPPQIANAKMSAGLPPNVIIWEACAEAETSADAYIKDGWHGAFTNFWLESYKSNSKMTRVELLLKTRAALKRGHYEQTPRLKAWNIKAQSKVGI